MADTIASSILTVDTQGEGFTDITADVRRFAKQSRKTPIPMCCAIC
jgi:hypothetical protein